MPQNLKLKVKIIESERLQKDIAQSLDMHASKLSDIIKGWVDPDVETRRLIAHELGCEVGEIF